MLCNTVLCAYVCDHISVFIGYCFMDTIAPAFEVPRTCNIISTSLPTLTTPSGVIANGTEDVILYCVCMVDGVAVGPAWWFFNNDWIDRPANGSNPYQRNSLPSPLIIPLFVADSVGTYLCETIGYGVLISGNKNITLTLPGTSTFI